jgi:antibiotic biosynthesis monooxygenase (ABM) superfamily enzyme
MAEYESDLTRFIRELKSKQPDLERKQREGRALWWDKELDPEQLPRWQASKVPQQPYVYQTDRRG